MQMISIYSFQVKNPLNYPLTVNMNDFSPIPHALYKAHIYDKLQGKSIMGTCPFSSHFICAG